MPVVVLDVYARDENKKRGKGEEKELIKTQHIFAIFFYSCKLNNNDSLRNDLKVN